MSNNHDQETLPDFESGGAVAQRALVALLVIVCILGLIIGAVLMAKSKGDAKPVEAEPAATPTQPAEPAPSEEPVDTDNPCAIPDVKPNMDPQQFEKAPDPADAGKGTRTATISTSCGDIEVNLFADKAPQAVSSFAFLASKDFYDNTLCHRLVPAGIYVLQCGDPTATGSGGPGYQFGPIENAPEDAVYPTASLAMARAQDPGSNGSQFFFVYKDSNIPNNNGEGYTVFGEVTKGMDIVDKIAAGGNAQDGVSPRRPIALTDVVVNP